MSNGVVLYEGPSKLDGKPIVVIATGLKNKSANGKTGDMIQTWILRADMDPMEALRSGADVSICGDCPHRGTSCYVLVFQAPLNVWRTWQRGGYPKVDAFEARELFAGRMVRLGSYGDPAAAPYAMWRLATERAAGWTGYTHQWRNVPGKWAELVMASADSESDAREAWEAGYRTFRVTTAPGQELKGLEIKCPASAEAGFKTSCDKCRACMGTSSKARVSVAIAAHGAKAKKFKQRADLVSA